MTEPDNASFMLGQLTGQVRELIHQLANLSTKVDAIGIQVVKSSHLPDEIEKLKSLIASLETSENQRAGAINFGSWLMQSPLIAWVVTGAVAVWAVMTGKGGS